MKLINSLLLASIALCGCLQSALAARVLSVRSYRAPDYTRLVFDLDAPLQYEINNKGDTHKLVIRLKSSTLAEQLDKLNLGNTPITHITAIPGNDHDVLVELTLRSKVEPRSFTLGKNEQYGDRLVVDLYDLIAKAEAPAGDDSDPIGAIAASVDHSGKRDIVVAISAGHGGDDPGAIGVRKLQEKQVTLEIASEVAAMIGRLPGYKAVMIRDGDYYVGLRQKVNMSHDKHADLFIEFHADAAENKSAKGATIYALSQRGATSEQARLLADKENRADLIGGVGSGINDKNEGVVSVLIDFGMNASVGDSLEIGQKLVNSLDSVTHLRRHNVEQAAFVVLKSANIPSLLVETGYITNAADAENLDSPPWRKKFAAATVKGITGWFDERPPHGTLLAWQKEHGETPAAALKQHKITRGETLSQIATFYEVSLEAIRATNQLKSDNIRPGQILKIPAS